MRETKREREREELKKLIQSRELDNSEVCRAVWQTFTHEN